MTVRPLIFAAGGLILWQWIIAQITSFHAALPIPLVGDLLTLVVALLLIGTAGAGSWWAWQVTSPEADSQSPLLQKKVKRNAKIGRKPSATAITRTAASSPPTQRRVQLSLQAIEARLDAVHEEATRRALQQQMSEIVEVLDRDQFRVVVIGTTSTGKTALINALLGEPVGTVAVTHATTEQEAVHTYRLEGVEGCLELVDTPGFQTLNPAHQNLAVQLAHTADLVVFTVANDLDAAEYALLRQLASKRVVVAFNKTDWYLPEEVASLQTIISERCQAIAPIPVFTVAAAPQAAQPQTTALSRHLSQVLQAEGRQLRLANALTQAETLQRAVEVAIATKQRQDAQAVVARMQWATAGAVAVTPLPLLDLVAAAAINARMLVEINAAYGRSLSLDQAQPIAKTLVELLVKLGAVEVATQTAGAVLKASPFAAVGAPLQAASAAYLTRVAGYSYCDWLAHNESDPSTLIDYLKHHLGRQRGVVPEVVAFLAQRFRVPALG